MCIVTLLNVIHCDMTETLGKHTPSMDKSMAPVSENDIDQTTLKCKDSTNIQIHKPIKLPGCLSRGTKESLQIGKVNEDS